MTGQNRKRAARRYMEEHGVKYTTALRAVTALAVERRAEAERLEAELLHNGEAAGAAEHRLTSETATGDPEPTALTSDPHQRTTNA